MRSKNYSSSWKRDRKDGASGFWSRLFFWIVFLAFWGAVIYVLFFSRFLMIKYVAVEGAVNTDPETIKEIAQKEMEGQYANCLEKSNIILFNKEKIKEEVSKKFRIIDRVEIKRKFPEEIVITISEKDPALIVSSANACFIADKKGLIFDEAACSGKYLEQENLSILINESNKEIILGENYIDAEYVNFILSIRNGIESDLGISLEKEMRTPSVISSDIKLRTKEEWDIFLNEKLGVEKELEMLQVVLENKLNAEQRKNLEYIDLRTESKVYYKFKNSEVSGQENDKKAEENKVETKNVKKSG